MNEEIKRLFTQHSIDLNGEQIEKLEMFYDILIEENAKYNLTSITEKNDVYTKHFFDSMLGAQYIDNGSYICDIGAGGGFPSIPLKILRDDLSFLLCDSTLKKVKFLGLVIDKLALKNVSTTHMRIEDLSKKRRETFDYVVSRGVAPLPTLLEYSIPLLKKGGKALCYKGESETEIANSKNAISILNCKEPVVHKYNISSTINTRSFIIVEKLLTTPKMYPRDKNLCRLNPL